MPTGPKIKLTIDLHRIDRYFPLENNLQESFDYDMIIDRQRYDDVAALLGAFDISDDKIIREFSFMLLWIEKEIRAGDNQDGNSGKFNLMWTELDNLKDYLIHNRITTITLSGEHERNKSGEEFTIKEDINIDRVCDGMRSIFRDEFDQDKQKRKTKGQRAWQRRKMIKVRNKMLNYFSSVPGLDMLSLEEQSKLIDELSTLAGAPE